MKLEKHQDEFFYIFSFFLNYDACHCEASRKLFNWTVRALEFVYLIVIS